MAAQNPVARNSIATGITLWILAALLLACGAIEEEPPARNPLAETVAASSPATTATATLAPSATPPPGDVTPPPASLAEPAAARAIELLAEWLGVPQTALALESAEAMVWPDACLGVAQPVVCAQVVTAGFSVRLTDALGTPHTMHVDSSGSRVRWAGEAIASGVVTAADLGARRITMMSNGSPLELRIAPGTSWAQDDTPTSFVGRNMTVGYDPEPATAGPPSIAWVVLDPP